MRLRENALDAYRVDCERLISAFGQTEDTGTANTVAWTCALAPASTSDSDLIVRLAERAVAGSRNWYNLNTLGAVLYRAGRHADAINALQEGIKNHGRGGAAHDWLFLAMAHHALGHASEAQQWFDKAAQWIDQAINQKQSGEKVDPFYTWDHEIELRSLRQEAERVLRE